MPVHLQRRTELPVRSEALRVAVSLAGHSGGMPRVSCHGSLVDAAMVKPAHPVNHSTPLNAQNARPVGKGQGHRLECSPSRRKGQRDVASRSRLVNRGRLVKRSHLVNRQKDVARAVAWSTVAVALSRVALRVDAECPCD